jgi:hypothetical protein
MGLANKSVVLYQSIKIGKTWKLRPVDEDSSRFSSGPFYVSWYDGDKKQMEPAGRDPQHALRMVTLKRAKLAYASAGGVVENARPFRDSRTRSAEALDGAGENTERPADRDTNRFDNSGLSVRDRREVSTAIAEYLEDCLDRQGKSGYGLASRTYEAYEYDACRRRQKIVW